MKAKILRRWMGRLLLALGSAVFSLGLCEVIVRRLYPEYGIPVFTTKLFTEFDPVLGWRKIPGFRGTHVQEEYTVVEQFNSKGLRGPEIPYEKPAGTYRVLVLGDSFTEGYTVEFADLFSEILRGKLADATSARVEMVNAGTGGYSNDQELLFFRTEGRRYQPDLVLVLYCANDAPMNTKTYYNTWDRGQKPRFSLVNGELVQDHQPRKTWDRAEEAGKDLARKEHDYKKSFEFWKPDTWFLHRLVRHALARRQGRRPPDGMLADGSGSDPSAPPSAPGAYRGRVEEWDLTEALLGQIQREAAEVGAKFLVFNIPEKGEVYAATPPAHPVEENLRELCRRRDLPLVPAVEAFRRQAALLAKEGRRLYWKKDAHWTPEGHRLAAELIARHLLGNRADFGL